MRRESLRLLAVLGLAAGLVGCDTGNRTPSALETESEDARSDDNISAERDDAAGTVESGGTLSTAADRSGSAGMDRSFEHYAAMTSRAEIELGRLGERKAQNPQVKEYAARLVSDHTKAMQELMNVAQMSEEPQLDAKHKQTQDRLSKLSGEEFDREFLKAMVEGHQEAINRFEQQTRDRSRASGSSGATGTAGTEARNEQVNQYAEKTLPTLRNHLEMAERLQSQSR